MKPTSRVQSHHPGIPEELRGTYAGLAHPVAIDA
jgi:pullulanase/glycogen debranching enzyme